MKKKINILVYDLPPGRNIRYPSTPKCSTLLVTDADCEEFLTQRGRGWVCKIDGNIMGFSIVDLKENNIWALFLMPEFEEKGIGKALHRLMMDWYVNQTKKWFG